MMPQNPTRSVYKYLNKIKEQPLGFCVLQEGAAGAGFLVGQTLFSMLTFQINGYWELLVGFLMLYTAMQTGAIRQKLDTKFYFPEAKISLRFVFWSSRHPVKALETRACRFVLCNFVRIAAIFRLYLPSL